MYIRTCSDTLTNVFSVLDEEDENALGRIPRVMSYVKGSLPILVSLPWTMLSLSLLLVKSVYGFIAESIKLIIRIVLFPSRLIYYIATLPSRIISSVVAGLLYPIRQITDSLPVNILKAVIKSVMFVIRLIVRPLAAVGLQI